MSRHGLIVTHVSLVDPVRLASGLYKRLGMLAEAVRTSGAPLRIFCTRPPEDGPTAPEVGRAIARQLSQQWNVDAEVVAVPAATARRRMSWLASQLLGVMHPRRVSSPFSAAASEALARELERAPRFIVAHRAPSMIAVLDSGLPLPPVYFDLDDIEHRVLWRSLSREGSLRTRVFDLASIPAVMLAERRAMRAASRTFVCSQVDAEAANRLSGRGNAAEVPNAIALPRRLPGASRRPILLMVGIYSYEPNADGAEHFISEVMPLLRRHQPEAELWLAGASPESIPSFARAPDGVRFLGFVEDIAGVYAAARIVICPIRFGSGTRVKLVEAAAWGKAIVSTRIGAEGLGMVHRRDVLFADGGVELAEACLELLRDDRLVERLGANARALAERSYDRAKVVQALATTFRGAAA